MAFDTRLLAGIGTLAAVVEAGSFVRAGEALGLTQSGVSRAVARLEERIGIRLFHRHARAVTLTEEGRRFFEEVRPLLAGIEDAAALATGSAGIVSGRLRVAADAAFAHFVLAPAIGRWLALYPQLRVELVVQERPGDLVAEGFDCAVRFGEPEASALIARKLLDTRVITCAAPAYIERFGSPERPADLAAGGGHHCIRSRDPQTGRHYEWEYHRDGRIEPVEVGGALTVTDVGSLVAACLDGAGITQMLELYAEAHLAGGALVPLLTEWDEERWPLYAYLSTRRHPPAKVRAFLDFVIDLTRADPRPDR